MPTLMRMTLAVVFTSVCITASAPTLLWKTSLQANDPSLEQVSSPKATAKSVFTSNTFNITIVDRTTGAFKTNVACPDPGSCSMFPGGIAVGNDIYVTSLWGNVTAYDGAGRVVWNITVPCQPSAFQGVWMAAAAGGGTLADASVLLVCDNAMPPMLIDGATGNVLSTAATSLWTPTDPVFIPGQGQRPSMWIVGSSNLTALAHPSLDVLWSRDIEAMSLDYNRRDGSAVYFVGVSQLAAFSTNDGTLLWSVATNCNSGVRWTSANTVTCFDPNTDQPSLLTHDSRTGALAHRWNATSQCNGGFVAVPNAAGLLAWTLCTHVALYDCARGEMIYNVQLLHSRYDQPLNAGTMVGRVLYASNPSVVVAIDMGPSAEGTPFRRVIGDT